MSAFGEKLVIRFGHVKNLLNGENRPDADVHIGAETRFANGCFRESGHSDRHMAALL